MEGRSAPYRIELSYLFKPVYHPWVLYVVYDWRSCQSYWLDKRDAQYRSGSIFDNISYNPYIYIRYYPIHWARSNLSA
jgi:hypothetical protein